MEVARRLTRSRRHVSVYFEANDASRSAASVAERPTSPGVPRRTKNADPDLALLQVKDAASLRESMSTPNPAWEPEDWKRALENIRTMRQNRDAPVDTQGCEKAGDENIDPAVSRFHVLVSLLLSSQTKDPVTFAAVQRLKDHGLTVDSIMSTDVEEIRKIIYPVGFWKKKAVYLKELAVTLKEKHSGETPNTLEDVLLLPGVGPKMAHIFLNVAWNNVTGIGVDTHVHRISNRLKWVPKPTKAPEHTRKALESWLPRDLWSEVNLLLVGFGQTVCQPMRPKCELCLNKDFCPSSQLYKTPRKRSRESN